MYDVIVVGAGPAGSSTAYNCAKKGLKTILIDQRKKPGTPKQCAEGINQAIFEELNLKVKPRWVSTEIKSLILSNFQQQILIKGKRTRGYVLDRKKFDNDLVKRATNAGAELLLNSKVIDLEKGKVILRDGKEIKGKVVVGADGPLSIIGKKSGLGNPKLGFGLQYEIKSQQNAFLESLQMYVDPKLEDGGYLWVFPKKDSLNVGLGSFKVKNLKPALNKFVKKLKLADEEIMEINPGHIPLHGPLKQFCKDNVLLVGDAAGHTNPLSGGGIPVAIFDGILVAEVIKQHLSQGVLLDEYQKKWHKSNFGKASRVCLKIQKEYVHLLKENSLNKFLKEIGSQNITGYKELFKLSWEIKGVVNKIKLFYLFLKLNKYFIYAW